MKTINNLYHFLKVAHSIQTLNDLNAQGSRSDDILKKHSHLSSFSDL